jgi:hypothetical protein
MRPIIIAAILALSTTQCGPQQSFASKQEAEAWFSRHVVVGLQCEGLRNHKSAVIDVALTGQQIAPHEGARVVVSSARITVKYDAGRTCILEKKVECDDSGKVRAIEAVDRPC